MDERRADRQGGLGFHRVRNATWRARNNHSHHDPDPSTPRHDRGRVALLIPRADAIGRNYRPFALRRVNDHQARRQPYAFRERTCRRTLSRAPRRADREQAQSVSPSSASVDAAVPARSEKEFDAVGHVRPDLATSRPSSAHWSWRSIVGSRTTGSARASSSSRWRCPRLPSC
jgi:hypothetical protein